MKAYKIFQEERGDLKSVYWHTIDEHKRIYIPYSKKGWNKRLDKMGPITAFKTLKDVKNFLDFYYDEYRDYRIFKIKGILSEENYVYDYFYNDNCVVRRKENLPRGTILLDRFKIIKEVEI